MPRLGDVTQPFVNQQPEGFVLTAELSWLQTLWDDEPVVPLPSWYLLRAGYYHSIINHGIYICPTTCRSMFFSKASKTWDL